MITVEEEKAEKIDSLALPLELRPFKPVFNPVGFLPDAWQKGNALLHDFMPLVLCWKMLCQWAACCLLQWSLRVDDDDAFGHVAVACVCCTGPGFVALALLGVDADACD